MKKVTIVCDCGKCKKKADSAEGWLVLRQKKPDIESNVAKLDGKLYFASIQCIATWTARAIPRARALEESAREMGITRGRYSDKKAGIYV